MAGLDVVIKELLLITLLPELGKMLAVPATELLKLAGMLVVPATKLSELAEMLAVLVTELPPELAGMLAESYES